MVPGVGEDPAAGHLRLEPPGVLGPLVRGEPWLRERGIHEPHWPDRLRGDSPSRFDQTRPKTVLKPNADFLRLPAGKADDVDRFLHARRKRLLDEQVAAGLKTVHCDPVMSEMGREDREDVRTELLEQLAVIRKRNRGFGPTRRGA